jgi:hypothetical protein
MYLNFKITIHSFIPYCVGRDFEGLLLFGTPEDIQDLGARVLVHGAPSTVHSLHTDYFTRITREGRKLCGARLKAIRHRHDAIPVVATNQ